MSNALERPEIEQLRQEAAAFLQANWNTDIRKDPAGLRAFIGKVAEGRWAVLRWKDGVWGRGLSDRDARVIEREFHAVGAPGSGQDRSNLSANTLLAYGTEALKAKLVGPLLRGEVGMCLLYSEPGAGSDLAGIRTRADRRGDQYLVNGQKLWTSQAATADYGMLIARTNWDVPKHRGISFFFCPMKQPGVEVRPLRQITNESHFNEVFLTDAIVPEENLLGELGEGWSVLQTALAYERSWMGEGARGLRSEAAESATGEPLIALAKETGAIHDPLIRQQIAQVLAYKNLNALNMARAEADLGQGASSPVMSLGKLAMSRILHEEARLRTAILGAGSLLQGRDYPLAEQANFLTLNAYFTSIGGGTDQIQRNIIGERVLGLPKEPEIDRDIPFRQVRAENRKGLAE